MIYYGAKMDVCNFATELQKLQQDYKITNLGNVYSVLIEDRIADTVTVEKLAQKHSLRPTNTSPVTIPAIRSLRKPK